MLGNCFLRSFIFLQLLALISLYQDFRDCSLSGYLVQKSFNVFLAMIRKLNLYEIVQKVSIMGIFILTTNIRISAIRLKCLSTGDA